MDNYHGCAYASVRFYLSNDLFNRYNMKLQIVLIAGLVCFGLAALDSALNKATRFSELSLLGKSFTVVVCLCLAYLVIVSIVGLVKKRK